MTLKKLNPQNQGFLPPSVGWLLGQELEARAIKGKAKQAFLERAGLPAAQLKLILSDQLEIGTDFANFLEAEFEIPARVWLQLEQEMVSHPTSSRRGGARVGAGRKDLGLKTKQVRISAKPEDMKLIEGWLKHQSSAAQSVASLILDVAKPQTRASKKPQTRVSPILPPNL